MLNLCETPVTDKGLCSISCEYRIQFLQTQSITSIMFVRMQLFCYIEPTILLHRAYYFVTSSLLFCYIEPTILLHRAYYFVTSSLLFCYIEPTILLHRAYYFVTSSLLFCYIEPTILLHRAYYFALQLHFETEAAQHKVIVL